MSEQKVKQTDSEVKVKADKKSREWNCLVYPESAPANWRDLCQACLVETFVGPLHDKDINEHGEPKKPHYHVVMAWPGPTTFSNAKQIMASFGGVIEPRVIGSLRGAVRYLTHMDNPEKAQYSRDDVVTYNGADYETVVALKSDRYGVIAEMQAWCDKYGVLSYRLLSMYAREQEPIWYRHLCDDASYVMSEYLKSAKWERDNNCAITLDELRETIQMVDAGMQINPATGEVVGPCP